MLSHGSTLTQRKKFATLAGGCAPEASTLPPVTVSRFFFKISRLKLTKPNIKPAAQNLLPIHMAN